MEQTVHPLITPKWLFTEIAIKVIKPFKVRAKWIIGALTFYKDDAKTISNNIIENTNGRGVR